MDLCKNGKLLCDLRKAKGMTQKQVADKLGVVPKTVSKWETGHGFPDVSTISALADILGVSEKTILSGDLEQNLEEAGNMKKTKFYVCPYCGSFMQGTGNSQVVCCGKQLEALKAGLADDDHTISISEIEDDYYIEFNHEMSKEHYISFVSYVRFDRVLTVRLYPEQDASLRFPKMYGGKLYYYCNNHGLFEYQPKSRRKA
ncbi:MAG: helix-turn-helix domain-containing protein [Clostridia bacterium]|nr:helix-turn-helix domain-containing protein [Clostridia bacterium]